MLEMNMERLLQNPVIIEVLNLVYEGRYSADNNSMYLSQTFSSFFLMDVSDLKSINQRLLFNITTFGANGSGKQFNLQLMLQNDVVDNSYTHTVLTDQGERTGSYHALTNNVQAP